MNNKYNNKKQNLVKIANQCNIKNKKKESNNELPKINNQLINKIKNVKSLSPNILRRLHISNSNKMSIFKNDTIKKKTTKNLNKKDFLDKFDKIDEDEDEFYKFVNKNLKKKPFIKKKKYNNMFEMIPTNVKEEEEKFKMFEKNYNPYFKYKIEKINFRYNKPHVSLLNLSKKILDSVIKNYGCFDNFFENFGRKINKEETIIYFDKYINELNLKNYVSYNFTEKAIVPTCVTHNNNGSIINIKVPIQYKEYNVNCLLNHEVGTHILRKLNDKKQIWCGKRKKYKLKNFWVIEEGLATINQLLGYRNKNLIQFLMMPALYYYAAYLSSIMNFQDLYENLSTYIKDEKLCWRYCLRVKRGIVDTSFPGGMYKDQAYFLGAYEILKNRKKIDFVLLYSGKINLKDLEKLKKKKLINRDKIELPTFMKNMNIYLNKLDIIAKNNFIDEF